MDTDKEQYNVYHGKSQKRYECRRKERNRKTTRKEMKEKQRMDGYRKGTI